MSYIDDEIQQQGANEAESPEPQEQSAEPIQESPAKETQSAQSPEPNVPFHEHPRFKELIEERRQYADRVSQYESRFAEMERRLQDQAQQRPEPHKQVNPFVAKLKEIDPAYGQWAENMEQRAQQAEVLAREMQEIKQERIRSEYETTVSKLHSDSKVPESLRPFIREQLDALALSGQIRSVKDVPNAYKAIQEKYTSLIDGIKREERASYVSAKSQDASAPTSQPKGKAPSRNDRGQFTSGDRETDMAMLVKRALKISKAENDI